MNTSLIGELVKLRYKLLWAKTRSRNGRIALFLAGYLLLVMLIALLTTGGIGAAMLAVRSGKAEKIARGVRTPLFLEAVLAANILGFGMSAETQNIGGQHRFQEQRRPHAPCDLLRLAAAHGEHRGANPARGE